MEATAQPQRSRTRATLIGLTAVLLWSTLALATVAAGEIPPFQLTAMTFLIGGLAGTASWFVRPAAAIKAVRQSPIAWAIGICGLFGYHFFYFTALRLAPPAAAGLIAYLWPLLIVLLSALLPGERLSARHVLAALMGLTGTTILLLARGNAEAFAGGNLAGYGAALACAFIWAGYSVASRRFAADVPTDTVASFCVVTAALAGLCHVVLESTVWPQDTKTWAAIVALGLGPVGLAFYAWDYGVKHGDIRMLGVGSYAAPVLSTVLLIAAGFAEPNLALALACLLIVGGAALAARASRPSS